MGRPDVSLYELFHRFYQVGLPSVVGADGASLYWALVQKSNELRDPPTFTFTNTEAKERSGIIHDQTFARARGKLVAAGLVEYSPGTINSVGVYSKLDLELDPEVVATRMRDSQPAHKPLTSRSHTTHTPLTPHSQPTHKPAHEGADFVSITREEHNRAEQSNDHPPAEDSARACESGPWESAVAQLSKQMPAPFVATLRGCQVAGQEGDTIQIRPPSPADRERLARNTALIAQTLRDVTGRRLRVEWIGPEYDARAGPGT